MAGEKGCWRLRNGALGTRQLNRFPRGCGPNRWLALTAGRPLPDRYGAKIQGAGRIRANDAFQICLGVNHSKSSFQSSSHRSDEFLWLVKELLLFLNTLFLT